MVHFTEKNETPTPWSMLQDVKREAQLLTACNTKLSQILANDIDNGVKGVGLRVYVTYCLKKLMKNNREFAKILHFSFASTYTS